MTAHTHGLTAIHLSHRTIKLIWTMLAVAAVAIAVTVVVLVSAPTHHAAKVAPGNPGGQGRAAQCGPARVTHPC
jgi:hypothetical protein